ncbi:DEAD/DEAH box helicase family protein, partial [bacterium]
MEKQLANVVFPQLPLKELTYKIPSAFQATIEIGHRVLVPVGRRKETGFIVSFPKSTHIQKLKSVEDLLESKPLLTTDLIKLSEWVSEYYMSTIGEVIRAMIPSALHRETRLILKRISDFKEELSKKHQQIINAFQNRDTLSFNVLSKRLKMNGLRYEISHMEKLGILHIHYLLENPVKPKAEKWISIKNTPTKAEWEILIKRTPRQAEILKQVIDVGGVIQRSMLEVDFTILKKLESLDWISIKEREIYRDAYDHISLTAPKSVQLTDHQSFAVKKIGEALKESIFSPFLLHGVTASGKTQVYLEIVREALELHKTALILIPEISLTPQAVQRYRSMFGKDVAVLHSRMSHGERFDSWR